MDAHEIEALLLRKEAVMSTANQIGLDGDGVGMLVAIIFPTEDFLAASRKRAKDTGPSALARRLAKKKIEKTTGTPLGLEEFLGNFR